MQWYLSQYKVCYVSLVFSIPDPVRKLQTSTCPHPTVRVLGHILHYPWWICRSQAVPGAVWRSPPVRVRWRTSEPWIPRHPAHWRRRRIRAAPAPSPADRDWRPASVPSDPPGEGQRNANECKWMACEYTLNPFMAIKMLQIYSI